MVHSVREAAARLQVWAFPLLMAQRVRLNFTQPRDPWATRPRTSAGAALGHVGHQRALSDPGLRVGVAPNVDTLYSVAWLDLDAGEHVLHTPDVGGRYASWQVGLADTGSPWAFGQRTHGSRVPPLVLRRGPLGSHERGGRLEVVTPHRFLMVCGRVLVEPDDPDDLARVHALQDRVRLEAPVALPPQEPEGLRDVDLDPVPREAETSDPAAFSRSLARVLRDLAPSAVPDRVREDLAVCDLPSGTRRDAVRQGLSDGLARIRHRVGTLGRVEHGWALNDRGPDVGDDLELRAAVALAQIYVNPAVEAVYPVAEVDADGVDLDGAHGTYEITFGAGDQPPARAFWSLTVYHRAGLLVDNDLGRHAVGDRTPGLIREPDGSLVVRVSATPPPAGAARSRANWLPAPAGPFRLMLRLYCPSDPAWVPPPVRRVGPGAPR